MRFAAIHKLVSYLLVIAALATLAISEATGPGTTLILLILTALSWFSDPGTLAARWFDRASWLTRIAVVTFSFWSVWSLRGSFAEGDPTPILNMVLGLLVYKLFYRRANRDYFQIYVLTFLLVLAAAVLARSIFFAVGFCAYLLFAVWTLILFHLRRELEDNFLLKHSTEAGGERLGPERVLNSRRVVGRAFFGVTSLVALFVIIGSALTFAAVPRVGAGFLFGNMRKGRSVAGFSDQVLLGMHGVISDNNQTVVLRASVPRIADLQDKERDRALAGLYWRGTVYDLYAQGQWLRSRANEARTVLRRAQRPIGPSSTLVIDAEAPNQHPSAAVLEGADVQEIEIVGLSQPVAFGLDRPIGYEAMPVKDGATTALFFEPRFSGEVALRLIRRFSPGIETAEFSGARYIAYSRESLALGHRGAGVAVEDLDEEDLAPYRAVPDSLAPRVRELARTITAGQTTPAGKVAAIAAWLQKTHTYTTDLKRDPSIADPLEDFLFNQQAGHCEYFASTMTILLRLAGVPSRYVNGFLGGEWNEIGKHVTVRDNRAHSWSEAYLGELGWVRADATPAGANAAQRMGRLRQLFDEMESIWNRWVVDYDLSRQIDLARRLSRHVGLDRAAQAGGPGKRFAPLRMPDIPDAVLIAYAVTASTGVAMFLLRRWLWRRRRRGQRSLDTIAGMSVARLYRRALSRLSRRGLRRRPAETPREFAARVRAAHVIGADALTQLSDLYAAARFGDHDVDDDIVADIGQRLVDLGKPAVRSRAAPPGPL